MDMEVPAHQSGLLASHAYFIAQAKLYPDFAPRALGCDSKLLGFLLYDAVANDKPGDIGNYRFMIDEGFSR